ncbi:trimethylamine methyltransferase family protein [Dehalobacterium formicoaceticum]|uniref:Trimethylamine methyltransferase family protein n=1 Tax=Dehalobacterium formicoaceticum TaxID=51515 RepID=A0ABT1Y819_9FIRM|nr:trimethylamine methyltransferase family protein [Dehalobacterium formicoaceticum]MCR6547037.1 trimethylamine methyltransferase family protein [Dehalobacterium formicoaceticum]
MAKGIKAKALNEQELAFLKEKMEWLLANKGIKVEHDEVLEILAGAGAEVNGQYVKFPQAVIDKALKDVPREFTLAGVDPQYDLKFPHPEGSFYTRTNTGGMFYLSENDTYNHITLDQVAEYTRLMQALDNINYYSLPSTNPGTDFPSECIDIHTFDTVIRNTRKHGWLQPYESENVNYLIEMAAAVAGGKEELRKRPIVSLICCSVPFLTYKHMDANIILQGARAGVPLQPCSLPAAGANAPITPDGIALLACAEVMAMIIMAQLIAPGTPCVATPLLFEMDMMSTNTTQSAMSTTIGRMIAMELFQDGYGIPAHTYATGSDSPILDSQAGIEQATLAIMVALSGGSVLGGAGQIETAKTISPVQLMIDNDLFGMVRQLKAGVTVDEEHVGWNELVNLKENEAFITLDHTFNHFRDGYRSNLFTRDAKATWEGKGGKTLAERAKEAYLAMKDDLKPVSLPENVVKELDAIVARADKELKVSK